MIKYLKWAGINTIYLGLLLLATYNNQAWAYNLSLFLIWLYIISFIGAMLISDDPSTVMVKAIPLWLDQTFDALFIVILVVNGWWWSAIGWTLAAILIEKEHRWQQEQQQQKQYKYKENNNENINS